VRHEFGRWRPICGQIVVAVTGDFHPSFLQVPLNAPFIVRGQVFEVDGQEEKVLVPVTNLGHLVLGKLVGAGVHRLTRHFVESREVSAQAKAVAKIAGQPRYRKRKAWIKRSLFRLPSTYSS
jgi:hypothetical protein